MDPAIRERSLRFVYDHVTNLDVAALRRIVFGHGNREHVNQYLEPVVLYGIREMVGNELTVNMSDLIRAWLRDATVRELSLRDVNGVPQVRRPRITRAARLQQMMEVYNQLWEVGEPQNVLPQRCPCEH